MSAQRSAVRVQRSAVSAAPPAVKNGNHYSKWEVRSLLTSPGQALDPVTKKEMEMLFRHDFSQVRIHSGERAAESARSLAANAYAVGNQVVFGAGKYQPHSSAGRQLLAHELAHVVQQGAQPVNWDNLTVAPPGGALEAQADTASKLPVHRPWSIVQGLNSTPPASAIQRDLATPSPAEAQEDQPDLTDAQIRDAIRYNRDRYNESNTRLIQDIMGSEVTGRWSADDIRAIAQIQEEYGLRADGKVGPDTFDFIVQEQSLEGMGTATEDCLTMFRVIWYPVESSATAGPNGTTRIRGHHLVEARFSSRCNPAEFQYRQFIAGVATATLGTNQQDLANLFSHIPGGGLPVSDTEDGNTNWASPNYGHRDQAGYPRTDATHGENQYRDAQGNVDQRNGITYRGEDYPAITVNGLQTGTDVYLEISFRGEIQRNGRVIQTRRWTDIDTTVTTP